MPLEPFDVAKLASIKQAVTENPFDWYFAREDRAIRDGRWLVMYCEMLSRAVVRLEKAAADRLRADWRQAMQEREELGLPPIPTSELDSNVRQLLEEDE